jgi:cytidine deaminase
MAQQPLSADDEALIAAAQVAIERLYRPGWHHIGAAVRLSSGRIVTAVHLEANVGRVAVCAEAIAIGRAIAEGERDFATIVAVRHPHAGEGDQSIRVVAPCGMCRELISDYGPTTEVIYADRGVIHKRPVADLLPAKYTRLAVDSGQ